MIPMLVGIILWGRLPENIATHFSSAGEVNGWSPKAFAVFGIPAFILVCHLICVAATLADPRRYGINRTMLKIIFWVCPVVSLMCGMGIYGYILGVQMLRLGNLSNVVMGIFFIIIGNYMPKCRRNYTLGIKTPWTLSSEENWNRTHRLSGWLFILAGVLTLISVLIQMPMLMLVSLLSAALLPAVYSFVIYLKEK